ncbi:hypothetical protein BDW60DRAFT_178800 [Aspergillus nidulans var. acristatus]
MPLVLKLRNSRVSRSPAGLCTKMMRKIKKMRRHLTSLDHQETTCRPLSANARSFFKASGPERGERRSLALLCSPLCVSTSLYFTFTKACCTRPRVYHISQCPLQRGTHWLHDSCVEFNLRLRVPSTTTALGLWLSSKISDGYSFSN